VADSNTSLGQQIFDISVAQVEAVVEPHRVTDNLRWKSVSLVCIHPLIVSQGDLTWQYPPDVNNVVGVHSYSASGDSLAAASSLCASLIR